MFSIGQNAAEYIAKRSGTVVIQMQLEPAIGG